MNTVVFCGLLLLLTVAHAQLQQVRLRSVSTYRNCNAALLGASVVSSASDFASTTADNATSGSTNIGVCDIVG
jgi:hypothetical protein